MPHALETQRLWLRPFQMTDVEQAYVLFETDPEVWAFDPGHARTLSERSHLIEHYIEENQPEGLGTLAIVLKETNLLAGYAGLQRYPLVLEPPNLRGAGLFYKLGRPYWGHGYAEEACRCLIQFAFQEMNLERLVCVTDRANERSLRLIDRLGMTRLPLDQSKTSRSLIASLDNPFNSQASQQPQT